MGIKFFGQFLLQRGKITANHLHEAVQLQGKVNVKLGTLAIDRGLMTPDDVKRINTQQRAVDKRFGELAIEEGLITKTQLEELLSAQKQDRLFLGEALVQKGFLSTDELGQELAAFRDDQKDTPQALVQVYNGMSNATTLEAIADVCEKMFLRLIHQFIKPTQCHTDVSSAGQYDFFVYQEFRGNFSGLIGLGLPAALLIQIASKMLMEELIEVDELALDGGMEFINTLNGNVCAKLSALNRSTEILPPQLHDSRGGERFDFAAKANNATIVVTPMVYPDGSCELCVIDNPKS